MISRLIAFLWLALLPVSAWALESVQLPEQVVSFFVPGLDLLDLKLGVDALVEPSVPAEDGRKAFEALVARLLPLAQGAYNSIEKLQILRRFLYESGPWNDYRPFAYDMADPLGKKLSNKLLETYIRTRRGNCITMPILAVLLGRRLGLTMTLAQAPFHVFAKFTDDQGRSWNLEATSGLGFTRDEWFRRALPMTDKAIAEGIYMRGLSETENVGLVTLLLLEYQMAAKHAEETIAIANVILGHTPRNVAALIWRGSAYTLLLRREVVNLYPDLASLPPEIRALGDQLFLANQADFEAAEALGWSEKEGEKQ